MKRTKILKPIEVKDAWSTPLARDIWSVFKEGIYSELLEAVKVPYSNASGSELEEAIRSGKIRFLNGKFSGQFTAATSKALKEMGAVFDAKSKIWKIPLSSLTPEIQGAVSAAARSVIAQQAIMETILTRIVDKVKILTLQIPIADITQKTLSKVDSAFKETVLEKMSVQPELTGPDAIRFDERYVKSVTRPIKKALVVENEINIQGSTNKFAEEEVIKLREEISAWVKSGKSRKGLEDLIDARLRVGKDRAKFIAKQETSLYTSQFKQAQYASAGIKKYKWKAVMDSRTRTLHRELDGQIFSWDNPPVVDLRTQERGHPGEAFGPCRCIAQPIVEFD